MKTITNMQVSNEIGKIIDDYLWLHESKPMTFLVTCDGKENVGMKRAKKLKAAFEKMGAEVEIKGMGNEVGEFHKVVIEITDPVANNLEKYLG